MLLCLTLLLFSCREETNLHLISVRQMTYQFEPKTTYTFRGGYSFIHHWTLLGECLVDGQVFSALTRFTTFHTCNSIRGRSSFLLIDNRKDTIRYDSSMLEELPVDLIGNRFVFLDEGQLLFGEINTMNAEILCFNVPNSVCFLRN